MARLQKSVSHGHGHELRRVTSCSGRPAGLVTSVLPRCRGKLLAKVLSGRWGSCWQPLFTFENPGAALTQCSKSRQRETREKLEQELQLQVKPGVRPRAFCRCLGDRVRIGLRPHHRDGKYQESRVLLLRYAHAPLPLSRRKTCAGITSRF